MGKIIKYSYLKHVAKILESVLFSYRLSTKSYSPCRTSKSYMSLRIPASSARSPAYSKLVIQHSLVNWTPECLPDNFHLLLMCERPHLIPLQMEQSGGMSLNDHTPVNMSSPK